MVMIATAYNNYKLPHYTLTSLYTVCDQKVMIINPIAKGVNPQNSWLKSLDNFFILLITNNNIM